jgi:hypothetical protein
LRRDSDKLSDRVPFAKRILKGPVAFLWRQIFFPVRSLFGIGDRLYWLSFTSQQTACAQICFAFSCLKFNLSTIWIMLMGLSLLFLRRVPAIIGSEPEVPPFSYDIPLRKKLEGDFTFATPARNKLFGIRA